MTDPACKDCRFFNAMNQDPLRPDGDSLRGECRLNPPTIIPSGIQSAEWPVVDVNDWCGKFEPKIQPEDKDPLRLRIERHEREKREKREDREKPEPTVYGVPLSEYPDDLLGNDGVPTYEHTIEFLRRRYPRDVARRPSLYTREEGDPILKGVIEGFTDNAFKREMYNQDLNAKRIKQTREDTPKPLPKPLHQGPMSDWPDDHLLDAKDPKNFSAGMEQREGSGNITVRIWGKQSSIRVEAFVDRDGKDVFQVFQKIGEDNPPVTVFENGVDPYLPTYHSLPGEYEWEQPEEPVPNQ